MEISEILSRCDHTLLAVDATWEDIRALCDDGIRYGVASVCIPSVYVKRAKEYVGDGLRICTVVGFPNGYAKGSVKAEEARAAIADGADEIDTVIHVGALKMRDREALLSELSEIRRATEGKILKVIIETCLLSTEEKLLACEVVSASGADYIKTSTGFSTGGATREDVAFLRANVSPAVKVKAAGGIASLGDAEDFIALGADRLGTSRIVKLVKAGESDSSDHSY